MDTFDTFLLAPQNFLIKFSSTTSFSDGSLTQVTFHSTTPFLRSSQVAIMAPSLTTLAYQSNILENYHLIQAIEAYTQLNNSLIVLIYLLIKILYIFIISVERR